MGSPTIFDKKEFIKKFKNITLLSHQEATTYFLHFNGNLSCAVQEFFNKPNVESNKLFNDYADKEVTNKILSDGLEKLLKDIGIDPLEPETLVLAYHCNAKIMGEFTREEFDRGITSLSITAPVTIQKLKEEVPKFKQSLLDKVMCKKVYLYLFGFALDHPKKHLTIEDSIAYWSLLLPPHFPQFKSWKKFCESSCSKKFISRDVWNTLWDFATTITPDYSNYDFDGAWPTILDEFVVWAQEHQSFECN